MAKKPSFFDRLTGANFYSEYEGATPQAPTMRVQPHQDYVSDYDDTSLPTAQYQDQPGEEAQLTVDVYQTPDDIVIQALVAGVRPDELDISIGRDMVTIRGKRVTEELVEDHGYVYRELYWGSFARTIVLPAEIDLDQAEASQKHGLLTVRLPKINKARQTKLKVRG